MGDWTKRSPGGIYRRIGSDGKTVIAAIALGPYDTGQGSYRTGWNIEVYPKGQERGHHVFRYGYKTLKEAKLIAETVFKQARKELAKGQYPA